MPDDKTAMVLKGVGFEPCLDGAEFPVYQGILKTERGVLEAQVEFKSRYRFPRLTLTLNGRKALNRPVYPHVTSEGFVCVFEEAIHDIDPRRYAAQLKGFFDNAITVLSLTSESEVETEIGRDLANHFEGSIVAVSATDDTFLTERPIVENSAKIAYFPTDVENQNAVFVTCGPLSFHQDEKLPETLHDFFQWLKSHDLDASERLELLLDTCGSSDLEFSIFLGTPGGIVGVRLAHDSISRKEKPLYSKMLAKKFLRHPTVQGRRVVRLVGVDATTEDVLRQKNSLYTGLGGKSVVLVGCGAIGGYLSHLLLQHGAGMGGGRLLLIDQDRLTIANTTRHRLGADSFNEYKAKALQEDILRGFPSTNIHFAISKVEQCYEELESADVVIDATGELSVREELNDWYIQRLRAGVSPVLLQHTWIEGNGAACFSFINSALKGACGRCVRSSYHGEEPRYKTAKTRDKYDGILCGGSVFAPYGAQASVMAAALATQHITEALNGVSHGTFRALQIDLANSKYTKPSTPKALSQCPACGSPN